MATFPSADLDALDQGLLSQEEEQTLRRVERSRVWKLLRDAMAWERENLLRREPTDRASLWKTWGQVELLGRLLQDGPRNVIWYTRYMKQREEEAAPQGPVATERTYEPEPALNEPPSFDM